MEIKKYTSEYEKLAKDFECGNVIIDRFLQDGSALDVNQGITYVMLSKKKDFIIGYYNIEVGRIDQVGISFITLCSTEQGYHLYHERNCHEDFEANMKNFVEENSMLC